MIIYCAGKRELAVKMGDRWICACCGKPIKVVT